MAIMSPATNTRKYLRETLNKYFDFRRSTGYQPSAKFPLNLGTQRSEVLGISL